MSEILIHYNPVDPATWFYLSSLLMIGLFFKFSRFWSIRNLDLLLLILLAPGLLFIYYGRQMVEVEAKAAAEAIQVAESDEAPIDDPLSVPPEPTEDEIESEDALITPVEDELAEEGDDATAEDVVLLSKGQLRQRDGYLWLICVGALLLARLLADPTMVRRPLLEPNLSAGGLTFIGCSLFVFLMANVITKSAESQLPVVTLEQKQALTQDEQAALDKDRIVKDGPGYALMYRLSPNTRRVLAIVGHFAIVLGMVLIGYWHFDNIIMGIGAATLYLMLPYTAIMTNEVKHVLPASSLVWAVLWYRKPLVAGLFLGLAAGMTYYPLFLLPLWMSFYWPRGLVRFLTGVGSVLFILAFVLITVFLPSSDDVIRNLRLMFGILPPAMFGLSGVWDASLGGWSTYYRIPVLTAFVALAGSMALWPAQKNLGTLLSCSAAIMVATQAWHGYGGGTYMAWYLPLLLLTIFRPNLEDRVALTVLGEGWLPRRLSSLPSGKAA